MRISLFFLFALSCMAAAPAVAGPPSWLNEVAATPVPSQDADVEAVQLLFDVSLKVTPDGKMLRRVRSAFRLLRQSGESRALLAVHYNAWNRVKDMQGWTIPVSGKSYEARFKEAIETAVQGVNDSTLVSDARTKLLQIPGAHPGDTFGYEYEVEENGLMLADIFDFQDTIPVLLARYALELPPGWTMTPIWTNHATVQPVQSAPQKWQWTLRDLPPIVLESYMPSWQGVAGTLYMAFSPPGAAPELASWQGIAAWSAKLTQERRAVSPEIRARVAELVKGKATSLERLLALATFVQQDIRYVAIELGIGGFQPHAAAEVFANRFGDCKDKSNLLSVMLAEVGIPSMLLLINTDRTEVRTDTPPGLRFNHAVLAVQLPMDTPTDGLLSVINAPGIGRLLFFDPTDEVTPVGRLPSGLQGGFGLLATTEDARLLQLPRESPADSGVRRIGTLVMDEQGGLSGEVVEHFLGDSARQQRYALRAANKDTDLIKPLEARLAGSLARFQIKTASVRNRTSLQQPLEWRYNLQAGAYASRAGGLLMVRPRVMGVLAEDLSDDKATRIHEMSFPEIHSSRDDFTIELPAGYVVESLPEQVDMDIGFAAYRSRVELAGSQLKYSRSYELRELQVPAARFEDYRKLQRAIARDERAVAVLKGPAR
jgi:transglutaminase-like putative cysteine protease